MKVQVDEIGLLTLIKRALEAEKYDTALAIVDSAIQQLEQMKPQLPECKHLYDAGKCVYCGADRTEGCADEV